MSTYLKNILLLPGLISVLHITTPSAAQQQVSNSGATALLKHSLEQFQQGHFALAAKTADEYLQLQLLPAEQNSNPMQAAVEQAKYLKAVSNLKAGNAGAVTAVLTYINSCNNPVYKQRSAFALAQYYFQNNQLANAIAYYEMAGIDNLSNYEIANAKFELAYSYFNERDFESAKPLFATIKELPDNKYYLAGNYYYGLLSYNDKNYASALKSFERIHNEDEYKDIVPYYEAEIHYFMGDYDKVLNLSRRYINKKDKLFYDKEMHQLTGQALFEQKKYKEALPYLEYYYNNSEKVRKEELYELAYTYYKLEKWNDAIEKFQPLSDAQDTLGQTSMYLLGDCYLKTNDKKGARNAFGICSEMDFNPSQKEAATFLNAKLAYELGAEGFATRKLHEYIQQYPNAAFAPEAKQLLSGLLVKNSNYAEAFDILQQIKGTDNATAIAFQQVALGRALQLMQSSNYAEADSILQLSLQKPVNKNYEAIANFWRGDIAYRNKRYQECISFSKNFINLSKGIGEIIRKISPQATEQNAQLNMGYAALELQNYTDAQTAFEQAQQHKTEGYNQQLSADAIIREADALFMQKDFDKAITLYDKAIPTSSSDYARYQKALILGLQDKQQDKVIVLTAIVNKTPASDYKQEATYELAVSYMELDKYTDAINLLQGLSNSSTINDGIRAKSLLKLAYAYQEADRDNDAITAYKSYIAKYPAASDRNAATDALRNLYINTGKPELYAEFLKEQGLPATADSSIEQTYYAAAETEYANNNWQKAIDAFTKYLNQFSNGSLATKAFYYRAESYAQLKDMAKSLKDYEQVTQSGWSSFANDAAAKAGTIALKQLQFADAQKYFALQLGTADNNLSKQKALQGLIMSTYEQKLYSLTEAYADTLIAQPDLSSTDAYKAQMYKAKALQNSNKHDAAIALYKEIDKKNVGDASAEARYRIAEILLAQNKLTEAETQASNAAQNASGSDVWEVKSYLLIADILTAQKDYFNAKATLQSIISNTKDKQIKAEATKKLNEVKNLEKSKSKLTE